MTKVKEGYVPFKGFKTFYKIIGTSSSNNKPLLVLHGGPGSTHNYLLGLSALAESGRQIIFYDQLGCGNSDMPKDDSLWNIKLFIDEIKTVRSELGLNDIHILGHSWGGMLAIEYLLTKPDGIRSTILASSMISMPLYQIEVDKLKNALPQNVGTVMKKHEEAGTTASTEYRDAYAIYKKYHLFRNDVFPQKYSTPDDKIGNSVYAKMWGLSEAYGNGTMKNWDRVNQLKEIKLPVLITSGQYDELTPWQAGVTRDQIPSSELCIITNGSHLVHIEQEQNYLDIVSKFLDKQD